MTPFVAFERLFFAVFGQTTTVDIITMRQERPEWTETLFKLVFGIYLLVSVVVLINLLIAMMSDTYQRIQVCMKNLITNERFLLLGGGWYFCAADGRRCLPSLFLCLQFG